MALRNAAPGNGATAYGIADARRAEMLTRPSPATIAERHGLPGQPREGPPICVAGHGTPAASKPRRRNIPGRASTRSGSSLPGSADGPARYGSPCLKDVGSTCEQAW
jgi:hypothetical protein